MQRLDLRMTCSRRSPGIAQGTAICAFAATGVMALTAITVMGVGLARDARGLLAFDFEGLSRSSGQAAGIGLHNARLGCATLLCAIVAPRVSRLARTAIDALLAGLLALNAGLVGLAFGAYGRRVVATTALHLPFEFVALSLAGGAYLRARTTPLRYQELALVTAGGALLLGLAATIETYASGGGAR